MRSIPLLLVACALCACGAEDPADVKVEIDVATPPAAPADDPTTKVDPEASYLGEIDVVAFREANGLPADADISRAREQRAPASTGIAYLYLTSPTVIEQAIDHSRVTRAVTDGETTVLATTQPFAEIEQAALDRGASDEGEVLAADPLFLGEAGPGLVAVGLDAEAVRAVQARQNGGVPRGLQRVLDQVGDVPVRAATLDPRPACVKSIAVGGGEGDQAVAVLDVRGKASPARSRLGRPAGGQGSYAFQDPRAEGSRLTVPFTQYGANLAGFLGERVYRCS